MNSRPRLRSLLNQQCLLNEFQQSAGHSLRTGTLGIISLTALLHWLTQFEQHFALYVANAVKMFLFMTPLLAAWFVLSRLNGARAR